jgi:hypothetical protein
MRGPVSQKLAMIGLALIPARTSKQKDIYTMNSIKQNNEERERERRKKCEEVSKGTIRQRCVSNRKDASVRIPVL